MSQEFNIPEIADNIKKKHEEFLNTFGPLVDKVEADHQWLVGSITAKVTRVLTCLRDSDIIDETIMEDKGLYRSVTVSKSGYNNQVSIDTDGKTIVMRVTNMFSANKNFSLDDKVIFGANEDNFNWVIFATELLDFIHNEIYSKKDVAETKIKSLFLD